MTMLGAVRARVGPLILGTGMAMLVVAFVGYSARPHHEAAPPPRTPSPVPSTSRAPSVVAQPKPPARPTHAPPSSPRAVTAPAPGTGRAAPVPGRAVVATSRTATGRSSSQRHPSGAAPSGPAPPTGQQPSQPSGAGIRATARLPLGVLPGAGLNLTVGGSR